MPRSQHLFSCTLSLLLVAVLLASACGTTPTPTPIPPTPTLVPPTATPVPPTPTPVLPTATPLPPTATPIPPTPTAAPPTPTPSTATLTAAVDVGGYKLNIFCTGTGTTPVIFENGLGVSMAYWRTAASALAPEARLCMYNRAGVEGSDAAPKYPRTSMDMMQDLHTLLGKVGLKPPFALVGHSLGGLNVWIYAGRWPSEVAGIVLVDSPHPDEIIECGAELPPQADDESLAVRAMRISCAETRSGNTPAEGGVDLIASAQQAKSSGKLGAIPLVVLSQNPNNLGRSSFPSGYPQDLAAKWQQRHSELQKDLLGLSTRSTQIVAAQAGHNVPMEEPEAVVNAIQVVLKQVKGQ